MKLGGAFADVPKTLKHLVFTEWRVAPDAISAIASYEAERRLAADFRMMRGRRRRAGKRAAGLFEGRHEAGVARFEGGLDEHPAHASGRTGNRDTNFVHVFPEI